MKTSPDRSPIAPGDLPEQFSATLSVAALIYNAQPVKLEGDNPQLSHPERNAWYANALSQKQAELADAGQVLVVAVMSFFSTAPRRNTTFFTGETALERAKWHFNNSLTVDPRWQDGSSVSLFSVDSADLLRVLSQ